jgi:alkanesulfonate monooxygenase
MDPISRSTYPFCHGERGAVGHEGKNFKVNGCHLSEPSPQRTPVLYQAGSSPRGRQFAARHGECVFVTGPTPRGGR